MSPEDQPDLFTLNQYNFPLCEKCGKERVYAAGGPHVNWCEPCLWAHVEKDSKACNEPGCQLKPKRRRKAGGKAKRPKRKKMDCPF